MNALTLYIGNKNYSSWSFRPWIAMTAAGIAFEEVLIPFDFPAGNPRFKEVSPTARVPVLHHGELWIWESLAIIEYVADLFPDHPVWPGAASDKAIARSVSTEMLGGFRALRNACPMNFRRPRRSIDLPPGVMEDVERVSSIWKECRDRSGGPYLFGAFSAADAMFAPVVNRFDVYDLVDDREVLSYMEAVQSHSAWLKWREAALAETWVVAEDEA
ncbi:MAG TPA: glutathione S-transferase family protein [Pseudorhizobium sp.]|jgi:glutathione S-transferase|nr:glutathione S-transferase family protein [Pseudorhizobium sp.]